MKIWARIQSLSFGQLWKLLVVFLKHPLYILPTIRATKETMETCNILFGDAHFRSGKANAFRHAYWNFMICKNSMKFYKNDQISTNWAEKFTNLYEKVTQNEKLDQIMDFHNNKVGRMVFLKKYDLNKQEITDLLMKMSQKAIKFEETDTLNIDSEQLIYIED
ncbi:DUF6973 domain-containing protein [Ulvibacter antarcticus]|uniref:DUF6973 domain-containing protein n=1 Tax=Ulvibacter antarcticus TaxID=442714 RepID=A0A3L9Z1B8_9FLAO|nr:hypothetical protein [Ulvibacter antarcticus]RMA65910.1 hypothetical protein BXY75_0326 [Ulvibacter antarcticus]